MGLRPDLEYNQPPVLQYCDAVGWVIWPVKSSPNDLYCVEWDVKPYYTILYLSCTLVVTVGWLFSLHYLLVSVVLFKSK